MITDTERRVIQDTWQLVLPVAETAADLFYKRLFELQPSFKQYFTSDLKQQKHKLIAMLDFVVRSLDWPESAWRREDVTEDDDLFLVMVALGRRHRELYNIPDSSYDTVGEAWLWTLDYSLGKKLDASARAAWTKVYALLANIMRLGEPSRNAERAHPKSRPGETC